MNNARALLPLLLLSCTPKPPPEPVVGPTPSPAEMCAALARSVDDAMRAAWIASDHAAWESETNLTPETEAAAAAAYEQLMATESELVKKVKVCDGVEMDARSARIIALLKRGGALAAPPDPALRQELANLSTEMSSHYGKAKVCDSKGECRTLDDLSALMAESTDPEALLDAWLGWRQTAVEQRPRYQRFAELANMGARDQGYDDLGAMWRGGYDMPPDAFVAEMDRLWEQVRPLYEQLHCHVRAELSEQYGPKAAPPTGPIPAHLLGNMWAQDWSNLYDRLAPYPDQPGLDVTDAIVAQGWDARKMVEVSEGFFTSMGLVPLPETFWERSMFTRPEDREVVCHASAWDPSYNGDARIKMCIRPTMEDLLVIHHELGHDYYYLYYKDQPALFQQGAHDGFHEAIGDTLVLSATPGYFHRLGLLDAPSDSPEAVINKQMLDALNRVAFLPFGLLVDRWRWGVFSGEIPENQYNQAWWSLRAQYQGVAAPVERNESDFDPGAKYHIPANTPYSRYFLSTILQFQFHEALCRAAGHEGPLYTCSIYGSEEAGQKLAAMLTMGASQPWPDALEAIAGTRQMDARPMVEYFQPLMGWLEQQNADRTCGW